ncbi:MAG: helix-turn-helix domain-containing protein [Desulfobacteria bacterium]
MAGRKSLLRSTNKTPQKTKAVGVGEESKRKKAVLDAVKRSSAPVKATLEELGLSQSTYYTWLKRYKANGLDGLEIGNPVSDEVWQRFVDLEKSDGKVSAESKLAIEETQTMTSKQDNEKTRKLLFKRFDGEASKEPKKAAAPATESPPGAAEPKAVKEPPLPPSSAPPPQEPMDKTFKYAIGAFACVIAILLLVSLSNSSKYYFRQKDRMVQLEQGTFAPMGKKLVASFSDLRILTGIRKQKSYTKKQAYGILSDYFVKRADDILKTGATPDLKAAKSYLARASEYALSDHRRQEAQTRLNRINFLVLLGKGELARSKGTIDGFETAKGHLKQAIPFASTDLEKDMITKNLAAIEYAIAESKISKGEKQLADLYREALDRHLKMAKEYDPAQAKAIDQEIAKIKKWLTEFEGKDVRK